MKIFARIFALLAIATVCAASDDLLKRRTPEYDYDIPVAGEYELPVLQSATDGLVLGTNGAPTKLRNLMSERIVVLSFIYTRCSDPKACMRATGALNELQRIAKTRPDLADKLLLITLSFDPAHDTPEIMQRYGQIFGRSEGVEWLFITTRSQTDLDPLLAGYGQIVERRKDGSKGPPFYHPLRVYLIDQHQRVRNIYSYGLLDPRLVATDVETLLLEK
ncbi:MAG TPA: SCO family protein [Verrucomicrobiae bacterium]|nr:SCO family protein [Verrucomicrobiae bacterium]